MENIVFFLLNIIIILSLFSKSKSKNVIPVFFAADKNVYLQGLVLMTSICYNANEGEFYKIYPLVPGDFDDEEQKKLKTINQLYPTYCNVTIIKMGELYKGAKEDNRLKSPMYYRLKAPSLFKDYEKIIYLDYDAIVIESLSNMYHLDLGDNYVLGYYSSLEAIIDNNIFNYTHYINTGVLLMNLTKLREDNIEEKFEEFRKENNDQLILMDQTVLNGVSKNKTGYLPGRYGFHARFNLTEYFPLYLKNLFYFLSYKDFIDSYSNPNVIHYLSGKKPWFKNNTGSYNYIFWFYAKKTLFYKDIKYILLKSIIGENLTEFDKIGKEKNKIENNVPFDEKEKINKNKKDVIFIQKNKYYDINVFENKKNKITSNVNQLLNELNQKNENYYSNYLNKLKNLSSNMQQMENKNKMLEKIINICIYFNISLIPVILLEFILLLYKYLKQKNNYMKITSSETMILKKNNLKK